MGNLEIARQAVENEEKLEFDYTNKEKVRATYIIRALEVGKSKKGKWWVRGIILSKIAENEEDDPEPQDDDEDDEEEKVITPKFSLDKMENMEIV